MSEYEDTSSLDDFINATAEPVKEAAPAKEAAQVAPEQPNEPDLTLDPKPEDGDTPPETDEEKNRSQNRFTKQTRALREAERKAAALEAELAALKTPKPLTPEPEKAKDVVSGAPDPEKYQYGELDRQYVSDLADYRAELKIAAFRAELSKEQEAQQQEIAAQREVAARLEKAEKIENDGAAKYGDFNEVAIPWAESQDPAKMLALFEAASETSVGADIFYHLAKNPTEADRVMSLAPMQQLIWMARFEATKAATPAPKKATQAPEPLAPARGSGGRYSVSADTDDLDAFGRMFFQK